jgi:tetratricopeptide (TPR) repeat protein
MEGTTVALELYFEHRNYLPAMFLGWPLAHALLRPGAYPRYRAALVALLLIAFLLLTCQRATTWGNPQLFGALSAAHETDSARAQVSAARQQIERGDVQAGLGRIRAIQEAQPESVDLAISRIGMECGATGTLGPHTLSRARHALATARRWNYGLYDWMQDGARDAGMRACRGFGLPGLTALVDSAESNPQSAGPSRKRDLWHVRGRIALAQGDPDTALRWFDAGVELKPDPEYALTQAAALGNAGAPALGVRHLDHYSLIETTEPAIQVRNMSSAHAWLLRHYGYYHRELSYLRQHLQSDAGSSSAARIHDDGK